MPLQSILRRRPNPFTGEDSIHIALAHALSNRAPGDPDELGRPALRLVASEGGTRPRGTRFGGRPMVLFGASWPENRGSPLDFVGQLDFSDLATATVSGPTLPSDGILALFVDHDHVLDVLEPRNWHLSWLPDPSSGVELEPPPGRESPARPMRPEPVRSYPSAGDLRLEGVHGSIVTTALRRREEEGASTPRHRVGGYADWIQADERFPLALREAGLQLDVDVIADAESRGVDVASIARSSLDWLLLWQVDSDPTLGFNWVDSGMLYVLIRREDLEAGRMERARVAVAFY